MTDPTAKAALSGLDRAVVSGRAISEGEASSGDQAKNPVISVLAATSSDVDQEVSATVERVSSKPGELLSDSLDRSTGATARIQRLPGQRVANLPALSAADSYRLAVDQASGKDYGIAVPNYWTVGPSSYQDHGGGALGVGPVTNPESAFGSQQFPVDAPVGSDDMAVRTVAGHPLRRDTVNYPGIKVVGEFDSAKIIGDSRLSGVSSATYVSPLLEGADRASRQALADQLLAPSSNLGGYPAQPPTLLTTLTATSDVTLDMPPGSTVALLGASGSGSGKSTLLYLVGAINTADSGQVIVDGTDLVRLSRRRLADYRRTVGFVFQRFHLLPALSAEDNVLAPLIPIKTTFDRRARARELLDAVGLHGRHSALPSRCREGSSSASPSPARSSTIPASCSPTNPPATSTPPPEPRSSTSCRACRPRRR